MENDYKYQGVKLTPQVFKDLLILLFDGKQFDRQTAVSMVTKYHQEHGGLLADGNFVSVFKKASQTLKDNGITNVGYGTWKLNYKQCETVLVESQKHTEITYSIDKELGVGNSSVYVYYYDSYKDLAILKGLQSWQCKVGRSDVEPLQRIIGQAGTCYPEFPHVALVIYCDDSAQMETALHAILKLQKKHIESAPGTEWFMTSPEEIEKLYHVLFENP